jgi:hypothetical protein
MKKIYCEDCDKGFVKSKMPIKIRRRSTLTIGTIYGRVYSCPLCGQPLFGVSLSKDEAMKEAQKYGWEKE